jgi:uncharacterized membrane protein
MQDPQTGGVPPETPYQSVPQSFSQQPYQQQTYPPNGYAQPPYPPQPVITPADQGLSDTAAGALAYVTFIPAIIFLVLAPYNTRPFVRFHAFQSLGLAVAWMALGIIGMIPVLGWIVLLVGMLVLFVVWILCIVKASQGSYMKLPAISDFAAQQSGYPIA